MELNSLGNSHAEYREENLRAVTLVRVSECDLGLITVAVALG